MGPDAWTGREAGPGANNRLPGGWTAGDRLPYADRRPGAGRAEDRADGQPVHPPVHRAGLARFPSHL